MELRMKKSGRKVLSVILTAVMVFALLPVVSFPMRAKAETNTTSDGLFDYIVVDNNRVYIKKYKGTNPDVVIPKEIEGMPVCFIDDLAFINSTNFLKTIVFEGDVEIIEDFAFAKCIFLESVVFNGNVGNIGNMAFKGCGFLQSVEFKGNVKNIGNGAFEDCTKLQRVEFNGNVGDIGEFIFDRCDNLESVKFHGSVEDFGDVAFSGIDNLKSVEFNGSVGNIGDQAFSECLNLKSVEFHGSVEDIGDLAFSSCSNLESVEFNGSVGKIGPFAFSECLNLKSVEFNGSVGKIGNFAFSDCSALKTVLISNTTILENEAFNLNTDVIRNIDGNKFVYVGQDLSEEVCKSIAGKVPKDEDLKILFYKGENEVDEVKNIGEYTAEILLKEHNNPEKYKSLLKTYFSVEKLNISDCTVTIDITSDKFIYNGEDQNAHINNSIKVKVIGSDYVLPSDDYTVMFSNDGGQTFSENLACKNVGSYQAKIVAKGLNCTGEVSGISFTIDPTPLTITASDASKECDGKALESKGYKVEGLAGNDSIESINVTGSQTVPGSSENVMSGAVIENASGEDVTDCYDITYVKGTLTVADHVFDQEIATHEHLATPATQDSPAKYYKSCLCGENGTETFEAGDPLPTYTITFEANGGIVDIEVNVTNEEYKLNSLPTPSYEGYDFKGWYTNATGGTEITTDTVFGANMTIYAHWEKIEEPKPAQDGNGENPEIPEDPEKPQEPEPEIPEKDWLDDLRLALRIADELGGAQTVEYSGDFALSYDIMTFLVEHPSITFIYHVTYEDVEYTIIIPAGKAVSSSEIPWYGPLWLLANYGNGNNK